MQDQREIKRILITGITGSGGSYLAEYINTNHPQVEIYGTTRWHSTTSKKNLDTIINQIHLEECDLTDFSSVAATLDNVKPDAIFHLASYANVRASFDTPLSVINNNVMSTANLLEAIRRNKSTPLIQMCSTSEVYGQVDPKDVPIKETCPIKPANPYAVSKATQDMLAYSYHLNYKIPIIRTRMFAYINPRREDLFASSFAKQVAKIEKGLQKELVHGNLDSVRTLIDVRDAMESYWVATLKGKIGEVYNIGGQKTTTVGNFLEILKKTAKCPIPSRQDPKLLRPTDVTLQIPDTTKFKNDTGWEPKYSFEESITFLLEYWRNEV